MKSWLYAAIPAVAFALVISNAFYGHSVFAANHPEDISKFSVYVRLQPEWDSHPANLLFEVTTVWNNAGAPSRDPAAPQAEHNYNRLLFVGDRSAVELRHSFDGCQSSWQPILYRYGIDMLRNQLDALRGADISGHPYAVMYPDIAGVMQSDYADGYVQFVPVCSSGNDSSYQYSVRSNDPDLALSVFLVPDRSLYEMFVDEPFDLEPYAGDCRGEAYASFSGECAGVPPDGGLLIWVPDDLSLALTKITVNVREVPG